MSSPLAIGLVYETHDTYAARPGDPADYAAEFEPESTVEALESAIGRLGHRAVRVGGPLVLLEALGQRRLPHLDAALSIAEGFGARSREAWAPILLEMAEIPALGSDPLTLSTSLDKAWTNQLVKAAGVPVAAQCVVSSGLEARAVALPAGFPLFVKPRWEGTAKGIHMGSRVEDRPALEAQVERVVRDYRQPALVEAFLEGAEYTVSVVGNDPPRVLPILQRALEERSRIGLHALDEQAGSEALGFCVPGELTEALEAELAELALCAYAALGCRDFARADFRLDARGRPRFLEINPLPTFAVDGSFGILAELEGRGPEELLAEVLALGLRRLGLVR